MQLFVLSEQDNSQNFLFHTEHDTCRRALPPHSSKTSQFRLLSLRAVRSVKRFTCSNRLFISLSRFWPLWCLYRFVQFYVALCSGSTVKFPISWRETTDQSLSCGEHTFRLRPFCIIFDTTPSTWNKTAWEHLQIGERIWRVDDICHMGRTIRGIDGLKRFEAALHVRLGT